MILLLDAQITWGLLVLIEYLFGGLYTYREAPSPSALITMIFAFWALLMKTRIL